MSRKIKIDIDTSWRVMYNHHVANVWGGEKMLNTIQIAENPVAATTELSRVKTYRIRVNVERLNTIITGLYLLATFIVIGVLQHYIG